MRERRRYLHWVFEATRAYAGSKFKVQEFKVWPQALVARSMQLIAGRTVQEYNQRKGKRGAFWEDRYHATAIEIDEHLHRCVVYIDLNMVRAGVVNHPAAVERERFL